MQYRTRSTDSPALCPASLLLLARRQSLHNHRLQSDFDKFKAVASGAAGLSLKRRDVGRVVCRLRLVTERMTLQPAALTYRSNPCCTIISQFLPISTIQFLTHLFSLVQQSLIYSFYICHVRENKAGFDVEAGRGRRSHNSFPCGP